MTYPHKGIVQENGIIAPDGQEFDPGDLLVRAEDDGLHIVDFRKGDFEWWYFDLYDRESGSFLKIVFHIGTDPLKTKVYPQLAISVTNPEGSESITRSYKLSDIEADTRKCLIKVGGEVDIQADYSDGTEYSLKVDIPDFQCFFRFVSVVEGWRPLGKEVVNRIGKRNGAFSWVIPLPRGEVKGAYRFREKSYTIREATGYHDHKYIRVDPRHPLHLESLITRWYWGKLYAGDLTVVFMDTRNNTHPLQSLMVAEKQTIIHSSNNQLNCFIRDTGEDTVLKVRYPSAIAIHSTDPEFSFRAELEEEKLLDRKNLLEGVPVLMQKVIKKWKTKPTYHGILVSANLQLGERDMTGWGNFESMVFRE